MKIHILLLAVLFCLFSCSGKKEQAPMTGSGERVIIAHSLSHPRVTCFAQDSLGQMWIGTAHGLNKYTGDDYQQFLAAKDSGSLSDNHISDVMCDRAGRIWVATITNDIFVHTEQDRFHHVPMASHTLSNPKFTMDCRGRILVNTEDHIFAFDPKADSMRCVIPHASGNIGLFTCSNGRDIVVVHPNKIVYYDAASFKPTGTVTWNGQVEAAAWLHGNTIWLSGHGQSWAYDIEKRQKTDLPEDIRHTLSLNAVDQIVKFRHDALLLNTTDGGLLLLTKGKGISSLSETSKEFADLSDSKVDCMKNDLDGNVWIGTEGNGFKILPNKKTFFNTLPGTALFNDKCIIGLCYDGHGHIFVNTFHDRLYAYDLRSHKITSFQIPSREGQSKAITTDGLHTLWITTPSAFLQCRISSTQLQIVRRFPFPHPNYVKVDKGGTVWFNVGVANNKTYRLTPDGNIVQLSLPKTLRRPNNIARLLPLRNGHLLYADNLHGLIDIEPNKRLHEILGIRIICNTLASDHFIPEALLEGRDGKIWIGTQSNGLLIFNPRQHRLTHVKDISCEEVTAIEEDLKGNVWVSTQSGLNKYNRNGQLIFYATQEDGIVNNAFSQYASCRLPDGTLVFGTLRGLVSFHPSAEPGPSHERLIVENLKVNNDFIIPGEKQPIATVLSLLPTIRLRHDQNNFSISYSSLDYGMNRGHHFFYKLDGYNDDWIDAVYTDRAFFFHIPAGKYTFRLKLTDKTGKKTLEEIAVPVIVKPEPWLSWWAWTIYLLVAFLITRTIYINRRSAFYRQRKIRQLEERRRHIEKINEINKQYFANVAHQLRTPLTMIFGPLETLRASTETKNIKLIGIMWHSVERMLRLVNQLMDFNKLETDALRLNVKLVDISITIRHSIELFKVNADEKGITFQTKGLEGNCFMYADADKVVNILDNLLSNAIKYTDKGGEIIVALEQHDSRIMELSVTDSGRGIPEEQLEKIFLRYYQIAGHVEGKYNWGTGIGLYYARKLARLHHGDLKAENRKDNTQGAVFLLWLPMNKEAYTSEELDTHIGQAPTSMTDEMGLQPVKEAATDGTDANKPLVMVIDDDTDISYYLNTILSPHYRIHNFFSAEAAKESLDTKMPDIILSDVVMEGKNGLELCREVKDSTAYCHIPVVLLTAKDTMKDQMDGLHSGADAYVTKPFNAEYLVSLIDNLLRNRARLRLSLSQRPQTAVTSALAPQDKTFLQELFRLMDKKLDDPDFNVSDFVENMHISHTKFINKVKALTGVTPSELFKSYKLNKAAELLRDGKYNVSEVSDMTGFSSLAHFSKVFKKKFGVSPRDYKG